MSKQIPVGLFIQCFEQMLAGHWSYEWGAAREGCVDCSGAFVYAAKKLGNISLKSHSSNYIPRHYIVELLPISEAKPGYAVFRNTKTFETDDLAAKYNDGLGNFKHMGLVSRTGKTVLHAKGTQYGFVETALDKTWQYCGKLTFVDYEEETTMTANASLTGTHVVNVEEGSWLNVRSDHAVTTKRLGKLKKGQDVTVVDTWENWSKIVYGDSFGWVYTKYLSEIAAAVQDEDAEVYEIDVECRVIITDEAGNTFYPVGAFTVDVEFAENPASDSVD